MTSLVLLSRSRGFYRGSRPLCETECTPNVFPLILIPASKLPGLYRPAPGRDRRVYIRHIDGWLEVLHEPSEPTLMFCHLAASTQKITLTVKALLLAPKRC